MVCVIKYTKAVEREGKNTDEVWVKFLDRFGEPIGKPMKLKNWIDSQKARYDPKKLEKFLEENDEFFW